MSLELNVPALLGGMLKESKGDDGGEVEISDRAFNKSDFVKNIRGTSVIQPIDELNSSNSSSRVPLNGGQESSEMQKFAEKLD